MPFYTTRLWNKEMAIVEATDPMAALTDAVKTHGSANVRSAYATTQLDIEEAGRRGVAVPEQATS